MVQKEKWNFLAEHYGLERTMEFPEQTAPSRKDNKIPRLDGTVHEKDRKDKGIFWPNSIMVQKEQWNFLAEQYGLERTMEFSGRPYGLERIREFSGRTVYGLERTMEFSGRTVWFRKDKGIFWPNSIWFRKNNVIFWPNSMVQKG